MMAPRLAVILSTEPDDFHTKSADTLSAFARQTLPFAAFEVCVQDGHNKAAVAARVAHLQAEHPALNITLVAADSTARAALHNAGVRATRAPLLLFLGADFEPADDCLEKHLAFHDALDDWRAAGIGPGYCPMDGQNSTFCRWMEDSGDLFGLQFMQLSADWEQDYFYCANASMHRRMFDLVGGFNEAFPYDEWDDFEFGVRWKAKGGYSRRVEAVAHHLHDLSFLERCAMLERSGPSARIFERLHPHYPRTWHAWLRSPVSLAAEQNRLQIAREIDASSSLTSELVVRIKACLDACFRRGYERAAI